jgi:hypothetical protein
MSHVKDPAGKWGKFGLVVSDKLICFTRFRSSGN